MASEESFSIRQNELLYNDERIESKDYYVEISPRVVVASGSTVIHSSSSGTFPNKDHKSDEELNDEIDVDFWRGLLRNYADEEDVVSMLQNEEIRQSHRQSQQAMMETESHREKTKDMKQQQQQNGSDDKRQSVNRFISSENPSKNHISRDSTPLSPATRALTRSTSDKRFLPMYQEADEDADMNKVRHNIMLMIRNSATSYETFEESDPDKDSSSSSFDGKELSDTVAEHWNDNNDFDFHDDEDILGFIRQSNKISKATEIEESTMIPPLRVEQRRETQSFEHVIQKIGEYDDDDDDVDVDVDEGVEKKGESNTDLDQQDTRFENHDAQESSGSIQSEEYDNSEDETSSSSNTYLEQFQRSRVEVPVSTQKKSQGSSRVSTPGLQHSPSGSPKKGPDENSSRYSEATLGKHTEADLLGSSSKEMLQRYVDQQRPHHHSQQQEQCPQENLAVRFANAKEANNDPEKMRLRYLVAKLQTEYRASKQREQKALDTSFIFSNLLHQHQKYAKSLHKKLALKEIEISELRAMVDDLNCALRKR